MYQRLLYSAVKCCNKQKDIKLAGFSMEFDVPSP